MCFNTEKIKELGDNAWRANKRSDVSEEITWTFPEIINDFNFKPTREYKYI